MVGFGVRFPIGGFGVIACFLATANSLPAPQSTTSPLASSAEISTNESQLASYHLPDGDRAGIEGLQ